MRIVKKILYIANLQIRRTHWFKDVFFPCCSKFWSYNRFNTKVVNLGSSSALHAFDYEGYDTIAANWAITRNSIVGDLAILKNYYSFLDPIQSTVLLPICPFSSLSGRYDYLDDRYYTFLYPSSIPSFSVQRLNQVMEKYNNPMRYYPVVEIFASIRRLFKRKNATMTSQEMLADANKWYSGWLKEFSIVNLDGELSLINKDSISEYCDYLQEMISFCEERYINLYIVIPPVYKTLRDKFDDNARDILFSSILKVAQSRGVRVLDYFSNSEFSDNKDNFRNSFFLNKNGARVFTKRVLEDIQILK